MVSRLWGEGKQPPIISRSDRSESEDGSATEALAFLSYVIVLGDKSRQE
jgi:hypothetical protein